MNEIDGKGQDIDRQEMMDQKGDGEGGKQYEPNRGRLGSSQIENEKQVFTFKAPWTIYSMAFSSRPTNNYTRLAIGSMLDESPNEGIILQFDRQNEKLEKKAKFAHKYAPTKIMWIPDTVIFYFYLKPKFFIYIKNGTYPDIFATSGEHLRIFEMDDEKGTVKLIKDLVNRSEFNCPLTSFDWNIKSHNYIGTASIDTTCTLWEVEKDVVFTQLIAHDKEVYDICFSQDSQIFASVGADGSCRQFDIRQLVDQLQRTLDHSTVLYETDNNNPIVRLQWNKLDANYLAIIEMDMNYITLLDIRQPLIPLSKLKNHKNYVNAIAWAPNSSNHLCSVGDDMTALIWDFSDFSGKQEPLNNQQSVDPFLEYKAESEISNLSWCLSKPEQLSICFSKSCQILNV